MNNSCEIIRDLLPLYHDNVCSETSRRMVEEHLGECDACKTVLENMEDTTYDDRLQKERGQVVGHYTKTVQRKSLTAGLTIAAVLTVPVLVCLIVNIAAGQALDWFFIVLTSLMTLASLTVVPLMAGTKKGLWTLGSFTVSLLLLLLTCCLYTGGDWLLVASTACLFGLTVVFLPYVLKKLPLPRHKGLIAMAADTVLLYLLVAVCGLYGASATYWRPALLITTVCAAFAWALFVLIRYLRANGLVRAGLCTLLGGCFASMIHDIIYGITEGVWRVSMAGADLMRWDSDALINANSYLLFLITGTVVGLALLLAGLLRRRPAGR